MTLQNQWKGEKSSTMEKKTSDESMTTGDEILEDSQSKGKKYVNSLFRKLGTVLSPFEHFGGKKNSFRLIMKHSPNKGK